MARDNIVDAMVDIGQEWKVDGHFTDKNSRLWSFMVYMTRDTK
jgi:hypothetical protein